MNPRLRTPVYALALATLLAACTTGQSNTPPPITTGGGGTTNGSGGGALQLAVGTINFSGAATGLDVLETFRGSNGYTAIPITSATLYAPKSLHGVHGSKDPGADAAGVFALGSASNSFVIGTAGAATLLAGADGWGIGPPSCSCAGVNFYPMQPQFADNPALSIVYPGGSEPVYGGPPAYPPTVLASSALSALVSIPSSWSEGFYMMGFNKVPSGAYALEAQYVQNGKSFAVRAGARLDAKRVLPLLGSPIATSDHHGGLSVNVVFAKGVKQVIVNAIDSEVPPVPNGTCITGLGFATLVFSHPGTQKIPDDLGNYGQGGAPTFCEGDIIDLQAYGFDYDDTALGPPSNTAQRPRLPAQADITISFPTIVSE